MADDDDCPKPDDRVARHRARTARINALTNFASRFAPAIAETRRSGRAIDDEAAPAVIVARDGALVAAFEAIARIADEPDLDDILAARGDCNGRA